MFDSERCRDRLLLVVVWVVLRRVGRISSPSLLVVRLCCKRCRAGGSTLWGS